MNKKFTLLLSVLFVFVLAGSAFAATLENGETYRLGKDDSVSDNLYAGGGDVDISGKVSGDLIIGGGNIVITGDIEKDALIGGGAISVLGAIGEDLRMAGGNMIVGENVGGDLVAVGGLVRVLQKVTIGGDVIMAGGALMMDGVVEGDMRAVGGELMLNGTVRGDVLIKRIEKLTLSKDAVIEGNLVYASLEEAEIADGAVIGGEVTFNQIKIVKLSREGSWGWFGAAFLGLFTILLIIKLAVLITAALLLVFFFKGGLQVVTEKALKNFGNEVLRGFIVMVCVPVALILLVITIIGILPAILGGLIYAGLLLVASIYAAIMLGAWLYKKFSKEGEVKVNWQSALIGIVAFLLIGAIPLIGWAIKLVLVFAALGVLSNALYFRVWK